MVRLFNGWTSESTKGGRKQSVSRTDHAGQRSHLSHSIIRARAKPVDLPNYVHCGSSLLETEKTTLLQSCPLLRKRDLGPSGFLVVLFQRTSQILVSGACVSAKLSLRVDVVENGPSGTPERAVCYSVKGFTCGALAIVRRDPEYPTRWRVHITPPNEEPRTWEMRFFDPEEALAALEAWTRRMEAIHVMEGSAHRLANSVHGDRRPRRDVDQRGHDSNGGSSPPSALGQRT
jgi:hypothetical protein